MAGLSPWLQPGSDTFRRGFCQRDTCRQDTCQLGQSEQPVEDEASPQQPRIQPEPKMRHPRSSTSTSKSLLLSLIAVANLMLVTSSINTIQNRPFGAPFFAKCCSRGTNPGTFIGIVQKMWGRCAGSTDVCTIPFTERVQHDSLFPKMRPNADHAGRVGRRSNA
jgi:hypothetical protein